MVDFNWTRSLMRLDFARDPDYSLNIDPPRIR